MKVIAATLALLACSSAAIAEEKKQYGNWFVSIDKDRFGGPSKVIAMTSTNDSIFAARCMRGEFSIAFGEASYGQGRFSEGSVVALKFRADEKPIIETVGMGLNDKFLEFVTSKNVAESMVGAKEVALRIKFKTVEFDHIFRVGKNGQRALAEVFHECPIEKIGAGK